MLQVLPQGGQTSDSSDNQNHLSRGPSNDVLISLIARKQVGAKMGKSTRTV